MNTTIEQTERKPITITPERLAANRLNALKSTGPRTAHGKAIVSRNARRHGMLARSVVIQGLKLKESPKAFSTLCRDLYVQFAPVGAMEETLVDQIASLSWRLRRVRRAEAGEIELNIDCGWWRRRNNQSLPRLLSDTLIPGGDFKSLELTYHGCDYIAGHLCEVRDHVEKRGELTEEAILIVNQAFRGMPNFYSGELKQFRAWLLKNPENLNPEKLRARHKDDVMKFLNWQIRRLEEIKGWHLEREETEEKSRQSAALLPPPEVLDKIIRYETSLNRQLHQALNQLERMQRRRNGETLPAPVVADISISSENCETNPLQKQ